MADVGPGTLIIDRLQADGSRQVKYRFELTDNALGVHVRESAVKTVPSGFDIAADMLAYGQMLLSNESEQEINTIISECEEGLIPLHVDLGGYYEKAIPLWNSWDDAFIATAQYFFSLPHQIDLAPYYATWSKVSKQDKTGLLGITNQTESDMNADVQIAIDLQTQLDSYTPYYDDDGNLIP